jgi:hypothetical protein
LERRKESQWLVLLRVTRQLNLYRNEERRMGDPKGSPICVSVAFGETGVNVYYSYDTYRNLY